MYTPVLSDKFHDNTLNLSTKEPGLRLRKHAVVGDLTGLVNTEWQHCTDSMEGDNVKAVSRIDNKRVGLNSL